MTDRQVLRGQHSPRGRVGRPRPLRRPPRAVGVGFSATSCTGASGSAPAGTVMARAMARRGPPASRRTRPGPARRGRWPRDAWSGRSFLAGRGGRRWARRVIDMAVRGDSGDIAARAEAGAGWTVAFADLDPADFPMPRALTPYGDAMFNQRQLPLLPAELDRLPATCGGDWVVQAPRVVPTTGSRADAHERDLRFRARLQSPVNAAAVGMVGAVRIDGPQNPWDRQLAAPHLRQVTGVGASGDGQFLADHPKAPAEGRAAWCVRW